MSAAPLRIAITGGEGVTGAVIRWWTWSWAAHAAFVLADGMILDATPSRGVAIHAGLAGTRVEMFDLAMPGDAAAAAIAWARAQVGKRYDWSAIAGMPFRRDWHDGRAWFCSELVAAAFEAGGCPLLHAAEMDRVTPRDLLLSPLLVPVVAT